MNILLTLDINSTDCLQLITDVEDNDFINLYNTYFSVWLKTSNQMLPVHKCAVGYDLYYLVEEDIKPRINNQCLIPDELGKNVNLGLLWNEHNQKIFLAEESGQPFKSWSWLGNRLLFFENKGDGFNSCMTFLYNDDQGNIVLEVSLAYPWFFGEQEPEMSYNDWLPNYKVLYKTILSKEVAQEWIKQLNVLYKKLEANTSFEKK